MPEKSARTVRWVHSHGEHSALLNSEECFGSDAHCVHRLSITAWLPIIDLVLFLFPCQSNTVKFGHEECGGAP